MSVELDLQNDTNSWKRSIDEIQDKLLTRVIGTDKSSNEGELVPSKGDQILRHPRLVLSVIGDSSSFVPQPWFTQVFQLGLIETAKGATDCLILYKGSKEKVSTLVWDAVDDFRVMNNKKDRDETFITLVGLGPKCDCREVSSKNKQIKRTISNVMETYYKLNIGDNPDKEQKLESYGKYHAMLLSKIAEQYVPFLELKEEKSSMKVPVLVIVAEGDMSTLDAVVEVLQKGIPVLILKGSGKAADLIAECIDDTSSVTEKATLLFGIYFHKKDIDKLADQMEGIRKHRQFVNIFDIKERYDTEFPDAIVNSIIRAWAQACQDGEEENVRPVKSAIRRSFVKHTPDDEKYIKLDQDLYMETENVQIPDIVLPTDQFGIKTPTSNGTIMNGRKPKRTNSIGPFPAYSEQFTTGTTVTGHNMKGAEVKEFMVEYQKSLKPASLRFYFYIAYQFIQEMDSVEDKKKNFQILLQKAIIADRVDYVTVLLQEEGVEFDRYHFENIYEIVDCGCKNDGDCQHVKSILKGASSISDDLWINKGDKRDNDKGNKDKDKKKEKDIIQIIQSGRQLCQKLLHYPQKEYTGKYAWEKNDEEYMEMGNDVKQDNKEENDVKQDYKEENDVEEYKKKGIFHDLLIWAIFANRPELAAFFWTNCENPLLTAILASCVLKNMASKAKSGKDQFLYDALKKHSRIFEKRAIEMQTKLYEKDPETAMELMLTEHDIWDINVSPLECAFDNAMLDFIAHSCAQRRLNTIWYKKLGVNLTDYWKNGFFCGCKIENNEVTNEEGQVKEEKKVLLFKFLYAPLTRFLIHYIIFLAAMVCYSAFLLVGLSEYKGVESIKLYEWILYVWLFADMVEEYRGVLPWNTDVIRSKFEKNDLTNKAISQSRFYRFKRYMYDFWNALDAISYSVCISAIFLRFLYKEKYARRLHSLGLFTIYMRFLHAILLSRKMGPKIIMIKEMLKDLFRFIGIIIIFMIGVGILYHANMYPAHADMWNVEGWTYWRIWKIMYIPYWQIYGEIFLDTFDANSTTPCTTVQSEWENNPEIERCNEYDWVLIVIAALYMLLTNFLLVSLVIALFSYRFEKVQTNSERLWRYWRYAVIMDYHTRVPAPLNLVLRPFMFIFRRIKKRCLRTKDNTEDKRAIDRMERLQTISANKCIREENNSAG